MSEFSRPVDIDRLPPDETTHEIAATAGERAALAERFGLLSLDGLEARVKLVRLAGGLIRLEAELVAEAVQECVVTLEPVSTHIEDSFVLLYGEPAAEGEVTLSGESELVEPLSGGSIDIGEAVAQQLSLVLDPFPRAPGAEAPSAPEDGEASPESPFAALAKWKQKG
ncbi:MAG TPA: DUF177 domain-containing protein [Stellaceae bacterium]|nr:DUF177 domain-containing protein [Stellaceae bacterium]